MTGIQASSIKIFQDDSKDGDVMVSGANSVHIEVAERSVTITAGQCDNWLSPRILNN